MVDRTQRPIVPTEHADEREHRRLLATKANAALSKDGTDGMTAPINLASYTAAGLPDPALWEGGFVYVSDETVPAFSDAIAWRRLALASDVSALPDVLTARSTAQLDKTSDGTLADIAGMSVTLEAGKKYVFRVHLSTVTTTGNVQVSFGGTSTATQFQGDAVFFGDELTQGTSSGHTVKNDIYGNDSTGAVLNVMIDGYILVNAGGTFTVQFAQNTSDVSTSSVLVNSTLVMTEIV